MCIATKSAMRELFTGITMIFLLFASLVEHQKSLPLHKAKNLHHHIYDNTIHSSPLCEAVQKNIGRICLARNVKIGLAIRGTFA